jgi:hypothetical protein
MILDRLTILQRMFPSARAAQKVAQRWHRAATKDPELVQDIIRMGGILAQRTRTFDADGVEVLAPIDPYRLAEENGRREFAIELMTMMQIDPYQLSQLTEDNSETD